MAIGQLDVRLVALQNDVVAKDTQLVSMAEALDSCNYDLAAETAHANSVEQGLRESTARFECELKEVAARFEHELREANERILQLKTQVLDLNREIDDLKEKLIALTKRAKIAEKECEDLRAKLEQAYEELDVAQATIQGLQTRVDDLTGKLKIADKNLAASEADKKKLSNEVQAGRNEIQRLLAAIQKLESRATDLEARIVAKDDSLRDLRYSLDTLDLCPYRCQKVEALAPAPPTPELEPEEDATKYVGVGMVVRVETGKAFPLIKKIAADGSAASCSLMAVDDALLEVDGKDCRGRSVANMTALFLGPVGSQVMVKGHTLSDHDHPPSEPSYTVTLIRGKKDQSPLKEIREKMPAPTPVAAGPVQTNSDDARLTRMMDEVALLQQELVAAREDKLGMSARCEALENVAREEKAKHQKRAADIAGDETQQALVKANAELDALQQLLDQKTKQLDAEIQETTCLKTTARAAQEESEQAP